MAQNPWWVHEGTHFWPKKFFWNFFKIFLIFDKNHFYAIFKNNKKKLKSKDG